MERDIYHGRLNLNGEESERTLRAANNYANRLMRLRHVEEAKALLRRTQRVARRVLGENDELTLKLRWSYAEALYTDPDATLDDLREAVRTLAETERTARRVLGEAHPITAGVEHSLQNARVALRARGAVESIREGVAAMTARDA